LEVITLTYPWDDQQKRMQELLEQMRKTFLGPEDILKAIGGMQTDNSVAEHLNKISQDALKVLGPTINVRTNLDMALEAVKSFQTFQANDVKKISELIDTVVASIPKINPEDFRPYMPEPINPTYLLPRPQKSEPP
jgi:hypothetical protein